jgi:hypothetical protein
MGTLEALLQGNHHQNRPALVMGSSPTVKVVSNFPFDGIRIGVGDMPVRAPEFGPYDYWVCANSFYPLPWNKKHRKDIDSSGARTMIASMSVLHSGEPSEAKFEALDEILNSKSHILYEQRHFKQLPCNPRKICCDVSAKFELGNSIQELLGHLAKSKDPAYSEGATVALHGYALAVLLGASPIYIAGVDLPTTTKDYRAYKNWFRPSEGMFRLTKRLITEFISVRRVSSDFGDAGITNVLKDFQSIADLAAKFEIQTYCLSKNSPLLELSGVEFAKSQILTK